MTGINQKLVVPLSFLYLTELPETPYFSNLITGITLNL